MVLSVFFFSDCDRGFSAGRFGSVAGLIITSMLTQSSVTSTWRRGIVMRWGTPRKILDHGRCGWTFSSDVPNRADSDFMYDVESVNDVIAMVK